MKVSTYSKQPFLFCIGKALAKRGFLSCDDVLDNEIIVIDSEGRAVPLSSFISSSSSVGRC